MAKKEGNTMDVIIIGRPEGVLELDWQELRETIMELYETWLTDRELEEPVLLKKGDKKE